MTIHDLPAVNASLNALSAAFIIHGWIMIKSDRKIAHIVSMIAAVVTSTVFLATYVTYHLSVTAVTKFTAQGIVRPFYLSLLISHVLLAFATVPLVICTLIPALRARYDRHRSIARWTLPVWLYVSITGVLVYMMLYKWFPPSQVPDGSL